MQILIILLLTTIISTSTMAVPVGSGFNYQGELSDGNSPANGSYDIQFKAYSVESGGTEYLVVPEILATDVTEGLFNINNVDFGDALYDGQEYWIEVSVRLAGTETYTVLSPRQRLNATPYAVQAEFLAGNGANSGEYLKFNGNDWVGAAINIEPTPFTLNGDDLSYINGRVGLGTHSPESVFHVKGNVNENNPVIIDGGNNIYMTVRENGINRGYIGSYQTQPNTSNEDFEIGTIGGSDGNMHIVTGSNQPRVTVTADGKVGINNLVPEADLHVAGDTFIGPRGVLGAVNAKLDVNSTATGNTADPLRVRKNGDIKFYVDSNGGASVGSWDTPPENGLRVSGDIKQPITSNGIIKSMIHASCGFEGFYTTEIIKSYNAVNSGVFTITENGVFGECILTFPYDISQRYIHASVPAITQTVDFENPHGSQCRILSSNTLSCYKYSTKDGTGRVGDYMLFIY
jgi:hypothetical protein